MQRAAGEGEQAEQRRQQAGPEARVVVARAAPAREAVGQEVVVARALGAAQDGGDQPEPREPLRGLLGRGADLAVRRLARRGRCGGGAAVVVVVVSGGGGGRGEARGEDPVLGLVGVQGAGAGAVGAVDFVLRGGGFDAEEVCRG